MNKTHAILVVLYNKKPEASNTLKCLSSISLKNVAITIVNNGPELWNENDINLINYSLVGRGKSIHIEEWLENKPLSILYNEFIIQNKDSNYYTIFDDDSYFDNNFFEFIDYGLCESEIDVYTPKIFSRNGSEVYYPLVSGVIVQKDGILDEKKTFSIASGLTLSSHFIDKISAVFGNVFDEKYALYGVDMSLFRRIRILSNQNIKINIKCTSSIYHSLSRIDEKPSIFRSIERLIDAFLTCRNYFCLENFIFMLKVFIKESPTVGIFNALYLLLKTMLTGEHPRSISWRKYYNE